MKYIVSTPKAIVSALAVVFFLGYGIFYLTGNLWAEFAFFTALGLLFCYQFFKNASYVSVDSRSVCLKFFGIRRKELSWAEIKEMGIVGEAVFSRSRKGKRSTGEKYIYFSPRSMDEGSRFRMVVEWPPKDTLYIEYTPEVLERTQYLWNGPVKYYNVEDIYPNTKD